MNVDDIPSRCFEKGKVSLKAAGAGVFGVVFALYGLVWTEIFCTLKVIKKKISVYV